MFLTEPSLVDKSCILYFHEVDVFVLPPVGDALQQLGPVYAVFSVGGRGGRIGRRGSGGSGEGRHE